MDRAVDTTATEKRGVGGIDDRIDPQAGYVAGGHANTSRNIMRLGHDPTEALSRTPRTDVARPSAAQHSPAQPADPRPRTACRHGAPETLSNGCRRGPVSARSVAGPP